MSQFCFESFRLDPTNARLWHHTQALALTPKAFAVLHYLVAHAGQLVTKEAVLNAVWPDTTVSEAVLKVCMAEIRKVLGETAKTPRLITTVHRRGYRFVAPVHTTALPEAAERASLATPYTTDRPLLSPPTGGSAHAAMAKSPLPLVERDGALQQLQGWLQQTRQGARQVVFITGEAGIGKSTLVETFLARIATDPHLWITHGQCIEHYGTGEAYLPVLEALGRLCRGPEGPRIVEALRQQAPTWLVQMPWLLNTVDRELLQQELQGATRERMLRELVEALETLTVTTPLVFVIEDLHWSDYATLDVVALLARRQGPARIMLVCTYRPVDVIVRAHPLKTLKQDLIVHNHCVELSLQLLSPAAVAAYLGARFPGSQLPQSLALRLHQQTDGNPLFLVSVLEELLVRQVLVEHRAVWVLQQEPEVATAEVPEGLRQMIEQQIIHLPPAEQRLLEVASVDGVEFTTAVVAAGLELDAYTVEEYCEGLTHRHHLLRPLDLAIWPDGTPVSRYAFRHALYQHVVYQRIGVARRLALHRRLGLYLEQAYGAHAAEMAAPLARHFLQGQDAVRAVQYLQRAAENAIRRHAQHQAIDYLTRALQVLDTVPATPERAQQELLLLTTLGPACIVTKGYAAAEVEQLYMRARQLCHTLGDTPQLFPVLVGLRRFYQVRAALQTAGALGQRLLTMAQRYANPAWFLEAHFGVGIALYYQGDFVTSLHHCQQGIAHYDAQNHRSHALAFGQDPGVVCHMYAALDWWSLGSPARALRHCHMSLTLAQELRHPFSLAFALLHSAVLHAARREAPLVWERATTALALAETQAYAFWIAWGTFLQGWAVAAQGDHTTGIQSMHRGLDAARATGAEVGHLGFLTLLAEAYGAAGQTERGLRVLEEARQVVEAHGERYYEAEVYRLQGEFLLDGSPTGQSAAEACFQQALAIARRQSAKSFELRVVMSLCRLWQHCGKRTAARQLLAETAHGFPQGGDTPDWRQARQLLVSLG